MPTLAHIYFVRALDKRAYIIYNIIVELCSRLAVDVKILKGGVCMQRLNSGFVKILCFIIAAVIVLVSLTACLVTVIKSAEETEELKRIERLTAPLLEEKRGVLRDLENFDRLMMTPIDGGSTMTILSINLDEEVYYNLWPILVDAEKSDSFGHVTMSVKGALSLSPTELPDLKYKMTRAQFDEIIASGWSTVLTVSRANADRLDEYITEMKAELDGMGIAFPEALRFEAGVYTEYYDDVLLAHGITNVIHEDSDDYPLVGTDTESEIWRVGMQGWSGVNNESTNAFNTLLTSRGGLVFGVEMWHSVRREKATHFIPGESEAPFRSMIGVFGSHVESGELHIDSVVAGRDNYDNYNEQYRLNVEVYKPAKEALVVRLNEIEAELNKIYSGEIR